VSSPSILLWFNCESRLLLLQQRIDIFNDELLLFQLSKAAAIDSLFSLRFIFVLAHLSVVINII
jgi:hypothetical protein